MKYLLLFFFVTFTLSNGIAQIENTNVSNGVIFDGEPYLAVNPQNPDQMVVAWMSYTVIGNRISIKTRSTSDGGKTWSAAIQLPHFGDKFGSADVSMAYSTNGTVYLSYIDYHQPDSGGVYVTHSTNNGVTWTAPVLAINGNGSVDPDKKPLDRPWLVVDKSNGANKGTLYLTTKPAPWILPPPANHPYFTYSTDDGASWAKLSYLDVEPNPNGTAVAAPMATPQVMADGTFAAVYPSAQPLKTAKFVFERSTDRGATFQQSIIVESTGHTIKGDTNSKFGYRLIAHPTDPNKLAFFTLDDKLGDWDITAYSSDDAGATWSTPKRVNDDAEANGIWQDMVWATYTSDGKIVAAWRDRRNGIANTYDSPSDFYFAVSTDNGKTFGKNVKLSSETAAYDKVLSVSGNDFLCIDVVRDSICAVWGDPRSGKLNIYFAKAPLSSGNAYVQELTGDENAFAIYPSITSGKLHYSENLKNIKPYSLHVIDMNGKSIPIESTNGEIELPAYLSNGSYFLELRSGEITERQKFILER